MPQWNDKFVRPTHDRFLAMTSPEPMTGCWLWTGAVLPSGYGLLGVGRKGKNTYAHRYSWQHYNNTDIPDGLYVCHKCDERTCVNPNHLFVGTAKDNMQDCIRKGRLPKTSHCTGQTNPGAKLTNEDVLVIRDMFQANPMLRQKSVAILFGVHPVTISGILSRKFWSHI